MQDITNLQVEKIPLNQFNYMRWNYIDIGTCNFETSLELLLPNEIILLIDPVKEYLDDLPSGEHIFKENVAITNQDGLINLIYINPSLIKNKILKSWIGGSTRIGRQHPTITKLLQENKISENDLIKTEVKTISIDTLIRKYKINSVYQIKIDTEGYESIILESILKSINQGLEVDRIIFEYRKELSDLIELNRLIEEYKKLGYRSEWATKKQRDILLEKL